MFILYGIIWHDVCVSVKWGRRSGLKISNRERSLRCIAGMACDWFVVESGVLRYCSNHFFIFCWTVPLSHFIAFNAFFMVWTKSSAKPLLARWYGADVIVQTPLTWTAGPLSLTLQNRPCCCCLHTNYLPLVIQNVLRQPKAMYDRGKVQRSQYGSSANCTWAIPKSVTTIPCFN